MYLLGCRVKSWSWCNINILTLQTQFYSLPFLHQQASTLYSARIFPIYGAHKERFFIGGRLFIKSFLDGDLGRSWSGSRVEKINEYGKIWVPSKLPAPVNSLSGEREAKLDLRLGFTATRIDSFGGGELWNLEIFFYESHFLSWQTSFECHTWTIIIV